jgi:membrane-associated protease RseP (regulator of RpoE activity)
MKQLLSCAVCAVLLLPITTRAQQTDPSEEKGTYLGVLFGDVPEVLYDQLTDLPRGQGVVVTHVLPDSPAAQAKLARHDIVLEYNKEKVLDKEHFARLIRADKSDHKIELLILRGGKRIMVEATLTTGPILRIGKLTPPGTTKVADDKTPKGAAKPAGPGTVNVTALPLAEGKVKVTIEYYEEGRLHCATCTGNDKEIETTVKELPERVQPLARFAMKRIRDLDLQNAQNATTPAPPKP